MEFNLTTDEIKKLNNAIKDKDNKVLSFCLKEVIEKRKNGYTMLSRISGVSRELIYKITSGKNDPTLKTILKIFDALKVSLSYGNYSVGFTEISYQPERSKREDL